MTPRLPDLLETSGIHGDVFLGDTPSHGYDESRRLWNAMIDHYPAAVIRCATEGDVIAGVNIARELGMDLGVRCGGHGILGHAVPEGGLLLDLRGMSRVDVDPARSTARVQGGALLSALDHATQQFSLATTAGNVSHTGVGGYTLGGGMGWLGRRLGLASDNLLSCRLITASGEALTVSEDSEPDLFWGLRGGGGNFGVVTQFTFALHPQQPRVLSVECEFPAESATEEMRRWRDLSREAPREAAFVAEVYGGTLLLGAVWTGPVEAGLAYAKEFVRFDREPSVARIDPMTYLELQTREDETQSPASRRYWKGFYIKELTNEAIDAFIGHDPAFPGTLIAHGGAIDDRPPEETAFSHRRVAFEYVGSLEWEEQQQDQERLTFGREQSRAMAEFACGTYVNTIQEEGAKALSTSYSPPALDRLATLKDRWDPENVFHLNLNIRKHEVQQ